MGSLWGCSPSRGPREDSGGNICRGPGHPSPDKRSELAALHVDGLAGSIALPPNRYPFWSAGRGWHYLGRKVQIACWQHCHHFPLHADAQWGDLGTRCHEFFSWKDGKGLSGDAHAFWLRRQDLHWEKACLCRGRLFAGLPGEELQTEGWRRRPGSYTLRHNHPQRKGRNPTNDVPTIGLKDSGLMVREGQCAQHRPTSCMICMSEETVAGDISDEMMWACSRHDPFLQLDPFCIWSSFSLSAQWSLLGVICRWADCKPHPHYCHLSNPKRMKRAEEH